tara:strand:+ start:1449 stop:1691 length:243 start_codon:yes stop_codon:yes gene_type:complete
LAVRGTVSNAFKAPRIGSVIDKGRLIYPMGLTPPKRWPPGLWPMAVGLALKPDWRTPADQGIAALQRISSNWRCRRTDFV